MGVKGTDNKEISIYVFWVYVPHLGGKKLCILHQIIVCILHVNLRGTIEFSATVNENCELIMTSLTDFVFETFEGEPSKIPNRTSYLRDISLTKHKQ